MNWNQHLTYTADLIENADPGIPGSRELGVVDGTIVLLKEEPKEDEWHRITLLTHFDIMKGLSSEHWNIISAKIRHLSRKGVLQ